MQQQSLFEHETFDVTRAGLSLRLIPGFLSQAQSGRLFNKLLESTPWQQPKIRVYGKWHPTPRLISFYGDSDLQYQYSNTLHDALPWTAALSQLKHVLEQKCECSFNCVLLNHYRDGHDSMGWHADDEPELGTQATIASLSLGAARDIHFKSRYGKTEQIKLTLPSGSLLIMSGNTQKNWLHHIPKRTRCLNPRVNLTFRYIHPPGSV